MSNKVKIFNDNIHPLKEIFKGEEICIDAKDYWRDAGGKVKVIDIFEANDFRGQYRPVPFDGSGKMIDDSRYYKKIKMEPVDEGATETSSKVTGFKCMAPGCKHASTSAEELEAHAKEKHGGIDRLVLPEQDEKSKKKTA